ncbi:DoxX family membrane protein [Sulfolobus sp. S-194]|uniref:DoxD domain-containing protein n=1 Tax=Sulfolobus sp. S-194 TaxID=2512240 RepID=UPI001437220A|nr:DoxD domain-containing protein [Sulfolobus sp. S-194]QIW23723.1 DoxX family membrane protein [Sulfolobus sp. S-194]
MSQLKIEFWPNFMRLALATIWIYAGVFEKLLNPGYLNPSSTSYVGITIEVLMQGPIMKPFLEYVVLPHVLLVGELVMIGEISFGILNLLGLMTRFTNTVAFYTNLIYFLSAYWVDTEEYGINLLMMIIELYLIYKGSQDFGLDALIRRKFRQVENAKILFIAGSILYACVIFYLLFV